MTTPRSTSTRVRQFFDFLKTIIIICSNSFVKTSDRLRKNFKIQITLVLTRHRIKTETAADTNAWSHFYWLILLASLGCYWYFIDSGLMKHARAVDFLRKNIISHRYVMTWTVMVFAIFTRLFSHYIDRIMG